MASTASGCLAYPDGRPVGVDTADALLRAVHKSAACACKDGACVPGQCRGHDNLTHTDVTRLPNEPPAPSDETLPPSEGYVAPNFDAPFDPSAAQLDFSCGDSCDSTAHGLNCPCENCVRVRGFFTFPRKVFSRTANFWIRPIAHAPASVPPPGRFHPVPTQPVFMPR